MLQNAYCAVGWPGFIAVSCHADAARTLSCVSCPTAGRAVILESLPDSSSAVDAARTSVPSSTTAKPGKQVKAAGKTVADKHRQSLRKRQSLGEPSEKHAAAIEVVEILDDDNDFVPAAKTSRR